MILFGQFLTVGISLAIKFFDVFRISNGVFCQPAHHFPSDHLAEGAFLNHLAAHHFSESTGEKTGRGRKMGGNSFAVLLGGQVDDQVGFRAELAGQLVTPESIEIFSLPDGQFCPHFQAVRPYPVERAEQPVESREDAKMFFDVGKMLIFKHLRSHVLILDALIG